jgi:hypothetical protein
MGGRRGVGMGIRVAVGVVGGFIVVHGLHLLLVALLVGALR